jgi:PknH-like protein
MLSADELSSIMGTSGMTLHAPVTAMDDHRNLLPNLNCLGVWQVDEAPIYESSHWKSMRQQMSRVPDTDQWNDIVVQSVVSYRTADGAQQFFTDSAGRWSKCANHNVNIQLNGQMLPAWHSGDLTQTDTRLAIPYTRGEGDQTRSCQRVLSVVANLILDIQACKPQQQLPVAVAAAVADKIESKVPN